MFNIYVLKNIILRYIKFNNVHVYNTPKLLNICEIRWPRRNLWF